MKSTQQATDLCHTFLVKLLHDVLKVQQVRKKNTFTAQEGTVLENLLAGVFLKKN
jgi:hypothetical protein